MRTTRRKYLLGVTAGVAGSLAGCFGGGTAEGQLSAPVMGESDADVVVKSWEDFRCPHCRHFHLEILPKIEENYVSNGTVRVERHDFPLPIDNLSWTTAVAARSVQAQEDDEAFWTFADGAYERQTKLSMAVIREIASDAGVDPDQVENDTESQKYRPTVNADRQAGRDKGVSATPSVFVNGEQVANRYEAVASAIDAATSG